MLGNLKFNEGTMAEKRIEYSDPKLGFLNAFCPKFARVSCIYVHIHYYHFFLFRRNWPCFSLLHGGLSHSSLSEPLAYALNKTKRFCKL